MNLYKRMLAMGAAIGMLYSTAYAQEVYDIGPEDISVRETHTDNSNLNVTVIKQQGNTRTTVFTGRLGDYDNGKWIYEDFSQIQFIIAVEWGETADGIIYIIPQQASTSANSVQTAAVDAEVVQPSLSIAENFYINNSKITETPETQEIKGGDNLRADYSITNTASAAQPVQLILYAYDMRGGLIGGVSTEPYTLAAGETKSFEKSITISSDITNCYVKAMLWDGIGSFRPLHAALEVGSNSVSCETATATVNCVANKEYNLVTTVENMPANDAGHYRIKYDPSKLELTDLCSLTYQKELQTGDIQGTNVKIVGLDTAGGEIIFEAPNSAAKSVSKVLNAIKFKALVSDTQTVITIE